MQLLHCTRADELCRLTLPFLVSAEAEHGLLIGLILGAHTLPADAFAAVVMDGNEAVGAAVRLDNRMIVSRVDNLEALEMLASAAAEDARMTMIAGAPRTVDAIQRRRGDVAAFTMAQMIYATDTMKPASRRVDGRRRLAEPRDRDVLIDAHLELNAALGASDSREKAGAAIDRVIGLRAIHVWETSSGAVVSCAGTTGRTVHGVRLNYVYTPPALRGKGYASAVVRDLTRSLLDGGRSFVFLHADRANPTATALYESLGFEHVADFSMIRLTSG